MSENDNSLKISSRRGALVSEASVIGGMVMETAVVVGTEAFTPLERVVVGVLGAVAIVGGLFGIYRSTRTIEQSQTSEVV